MQMASTFGAMPLDDEPQVLHEVARAQRVERGARFKTFLLRQVIALPVRSAARSAMHAVTDYFIRHLARRSVRLSAIADKLEECLADYKQSIAEQHRVPSEQFIADFDKLHESNTRLVILCSQNIDQLRVLNPHSRLALGFERVRAQVLRIDAAALVYLEWGRAARDTRVTQYALQKITNRIDQKLETYDEHTDVEPDLMARAKRAVERIDQH